MSREWSTEPISYLITGHNWWDTSVDQIELLFFVVLITPVVEVPASRYTHLPTTLEKFLLVILICNENFMTSKLLFATNFMRYLLLLQFFIIICHFVVVVQTVITRKNLFTLMNQFWKIYSIFTCNPISLLFNDVVDFLLYIRCTLHLFVLCVQNLHIYDWMAHTIDLFAL